MAALFRAAALGLCLLPLGCSDPKTADDDVSADPGADASDGDGDSETADDEEIVAPSDAPYLSDEDGLDTPELGAGLVSGIEATLALLPQLTADVIFASYAEATADQDAGCPVWTVDESGAPYWYGSCQTTAGTAYEGYAMLADMDGLYDGYNTWTGQQYYGVNAVVTDTGLAWSSNGGAAFATAVTDDGADALYNQIQGSFAWEGPAAAGTWLETTVDADFFWYSARVADRPGGSVSIQGRLGIEDPDVQTVIFEIEAIDPAWGAGCADEPAGSLSVLTAGGDWIDVFFDGSTWEALDPGPAVCDGCGQAWYKGAPIGSVCLDFPALADPAHWPWPR